MTNGAMYLEDTINRRQSRWLTLDTAAKGDAKVLAGPTNDGWYHIQVRRGEGAGLAVSASAGPVLDVPQRWFPSTHPAPPPTRLCPRPIRRSTL